MGKMATYSGKNVKWDEAWNSKLTGYPDKVAWDAPTKVNPDKDGWYPVPVPGETVAV
jgi:hypothetical protein